jgi:hypothetical protein
MIQRKQSLFLALAAVCVALMYLFSISVYNLPDQVEEISFSVLGTTVGGQPALFAPVPLVPLGIVAGVAIALLLFSIFLYKDRKRQLRFANFGYLVLIGLFAAVFMSEHSMAAFMGSKQGVGNVRLGYFLPLIALVFVFLAVRGIKADEELVKSADRLR